MSAPRLNLSLILSCVMSNLMTLKHCHFVLWLTLAIPAALIWTFLPMSSMTCPQPLLVRPLLGQIRITEYHHIFQLITSSKESYNFLFHFLGQSVDKEIHLSRLWVYKVCCFDNLFLKRLKGVSCPHPCIEQPLTVCLLPRMEPCSNLLFLKLLLSTLSRAAILLTNLELDSNKEGNTLAAMSSLHPFATSNHSKQLTKSSISTSSRLYQGFMFILSTIVLI